MIFLLSLIGNKKFIGKGFAKFILQEFIELYGANVTRILVDPNPNNNRAIHVYKTCGFLPLEIFNVDKNPHQIMVYDKNVTTK
jgi:RimJ/RimL family protein N-acetyltransferase